MIHNCFMIFSWQSSFIRRMISYQNMVIPWRHIRWGQRMVISLRFTGFLILQEELKALDLSCIYNTGWHVLQISLSHPDQKIPWVRNIHYKLYATMLSLIVFLSHTGMNTIKVWKERKYLIRISMHEWRQGAVQADVWRC